MRRIETGFYQNHSDPVLIDNFFASRQPQTALGKLAEARALREQGKDAEAQALVRDVWRHSDLLASLEAHVRSEFGAYLNTADYEARADRLLYEEDKRRRSAQCRARGAGRSRAGAPARRHQRRYDK